MFKNFFVFLTIAISYQCLVASGYGAGQEDSKKCEKTKHPATCKDALAGHNASGIYLLELPNSALQPFYAYCLADPKNGDPWMIIQRRKDGSMDFRRDWYTYKYGFGSLNGEFWLGLEQLHAITHTQMHEIWFQMEDFKGSSYSAYYDQFAIGDSDSNYVLSVLGKYSGDAGDSFGYHAGFQFSTKDLDNDSREDDSCIGTITNGGWWFGNCRESNFNGKYFEDETSEAIGINWYGVHGREYSMKAVHMAIRPVESDLNNLIPRDSYDI